MSRVSTAAFIAAILSSVALGQTFVNGQNLATAAGQANPLANYPGGGFNATDASALESNGGTFGYAITGGATSATAQANFRLADDFTVPCGEIWTLTSIKVFGYETSTYAFPPVSLLSGGNYNIWNGKPGTSGASIIVDKHGANQWTGVSNFTNIHRVTATTLTNAQRPVMDVTMNTTDPNTMNNIVLGPGTYWLDYQLQGNGLAAVFTPPITIGTVAGMNQAVVTGNAVQFTGSFTVANPAFSMMGTWTNQVVNVDAASGNANAQGIPFEITYTAASTNCYTYDILQSGGAGTPVTLANLGGTPGDSYLNVIQVVPQGSGPPPGYPNGWFYGLDVSLASLTGFLTGGPAFSGVIPPSGSVVIGPIPIVGLPGAISLYYVSLEVSPAGAVIAVDGPKTTDILP